MRLFKVNAVTRSPLWVNLDSVVQVTYRSPTDGGPKLELELQSGGYDVLDPDDIKNVALILGISLT
jgi:hypothetical protein